LQRGNDVSSTVRLEVDSLDWPVLCAARSR
jgi:hypothetical protein